MNKSANYSVLSITVIRKSPSTITYHLAHGLKGRSFCWGAMTGRDRMIIDQLEVGCSYFIRTSTDSSGCQHWTEAKLLGGSKLKDDAITRKVAQVKSKPQIRKEFLDDLIEY